MTVLATIHQPSADIFVLFDRVIVLSEGHTIYTGPPEKVRSYFEQFGLKMGKYSNPADKVSIIAAEPKSVLNESIDIVTLHESCKHNLSKYFMLTDDEKQGYESKLNRLSIVGKTREIGFLKQYKLLFLRFLTYTSRKPMLIVTKILIGLMQALLQAALFHGIGAVKFS